MGFEHILNSNRKMVFKRMLNSNRKMGYERTLKPKVWLCIFIFKIRDYFTEASISSSGNKIDRL